MCPKCGVTYSTDVAGASVCKNANCPWFAANGYPYRPNADLQAEEATAVASANAT